MLSYKNAFAILGAVILCLAPLPFIMRLPEKSKGGPPPEEVMGHYQDTPPAWSRQ